MTRILIALCFATLVPAQTLPDGPGKELTEKMCTPCHTLANVLKARLTKERWTAVVDDMVARGAEGTDAEIERVTNYLATNFALKKVNVNKASAGELVSALGITAADAATIVSYRNDKGTFKALKELLKVPGIDTKKIAIVKDSIEY